MSVIIKIQSGDIERAYLQGEDGACGFVKTWPPQC